MSKDIEKRRETLTEARSAPSIVDYGALYASSESNYLGYPTFFGAKEEFEVKSNPSSS